MYWPRFHSPNLNGPVPTGAIHLPSGPSESLCRTAVCPQSGRASVPRNSAVGWSSLMTTVLASGASTASIFANPLAVELGEAAPLRGRIEPALERPDDVVGGHGRAVVELHAAAQLERVGLAVLGDRPAFRQHRPDRGVFAEGDQALDHVRHHAVGVAVAIGAGIGRADVGVHARPQAFRRRWRRRTERRGRSRRTSMRRRVRSMIVRSAS